MIKLCSGDYKGNTPLMLAAMNGNLALVELLLQTAANPNYVNSVGQTAANMARLKGFSDCVNLIHEYEADKSTEHRKITLSEFFIVGDCD